MTRVQNLSLLSLCSLDCFFISLTLPSFLLVEKQDNNSNQVTRKLSFQNYVCQVPGPQPGLNRIIAVTNGTGSSNKGVLMAEGVEGHLSCEPARTASFGALWRNL